MPKVKVWGGTHPDEMAAMKVADSLEEYPLPNIESGIANPLARKLGRRVVDVNLASAYPGDKNATEYERRRAVEVLAESQGFDAVIDLHNINYYGENAAVIDKHRGVSPRVLGFLGSLGIRNLVLSDFNNMQRYLPNAFLLETLRSGLGSDIDQLRTAFDRLANDPALATANAADFAWSSRMGSIHVDTASPDIISLELRDTLRGFDILPEEIAASMGYPDRQVGFMSWRYTANARGYWAELVEPAPVPDDSEWPKGLDTV